MLIQALERASGNKSLAARMLGISRDTLRYKLAKLDGKTPRRP
jgi:DNA-binding protein Fis